MIRYDYKTILNEDNIYIGIKKEINTEYPTKQYIESVSNSINSEKLYELLKLENIGKQELKLLKIENDWYDLMVSFINFNNIKIELEKQLTDNTDKINSNITTGLLTQDELDEINTKISSTTIDINNSFDLIVKLENRYKWLKAFREDVDLNDSSFNRPVFKDKLLLSTKKEVIRHKINKKVRDVNDTVADLSKMNALLMAMISSIYEVLPESEKDLLNPNRRGLIEYGINKWDNSSTRADRQLAVEGTKLIDRLFNREVETANIVDEFI